MHINTPEVQALVRSAFPGYTGRRFEVEAFTGPKTLASYWSGGSRDYWELIHLETMKAIGIPENGSGFNGAALELSELPENVALVKQTMGGYEHVVIYLRPENMTKMLPAPVELTREERIVLCATSSLKSSYGGIKNYRFHEAKEKTGITLEAWDAAKASLIQRRMLNLAGAITDDGRNAIGHVSLYDLKA